MRKMLKPRFHMPVSLSVSSLKLSIIIVSWNTSGLLKKCLTSIFQGNTGLSFEVIVVDNASSDGSPEMVKREFPLVKLIRNMENKGFSKANNQAMRTANGEYILLLNSDIVISESSILEKWTDFMERHSEAGASGCKLVFPDGGHQVGDSGYKPSLKTITNYAFFFSKIFPQGCKGLFYNSEKLTSEVVVDWVCGAAFMVRKNILSEVGLLDERIFMFAEDIEWGCRISSFGHKVFYLPYLEIIHLKGASSQKQEDQKKFSLLWLENLRNLYCSYNRRQPLVFYDIIMSAAFLLRAIMYFMKYMVNKDSLTKLKFRRMFCYMQFSLMRIGKP